MKQKWLVVSTGFALFSMFFGSGNLVFPIAVGQESEGHYLLAALGILLTGVLVPFLGVFGMLLCKGDVHSFFSSFGKKGTFWFSLFALALMGPFGVLARCLTVAHGALQLLVPSIGLEVASFGLCCLIYVLTINKNTIVSVLGSALTPFLLVSIAAIAFFGFKDGVALEPVSLDGWQALKNGFFQGYQTMDLLAAFFFSTFVINHLQSTISKDSQDSLLIPTFVKSSLIGAGILSLVYVALVAMGWIYAPQLFGAPPQEMLGMIAMATLGSMAAPFVCAVVVLACLTTAIVLTSLFSEFLRKDIAQEKIGNKSTLLITLTIGFLVSTLDFAGIGKFLGPILEATYPALIVLTLLNIANKLWGVQQSRWPVLLTLAAKLCWV